MVIVAVLLLLLAGCASHNTLERQVKAMQVKSLIECVRHVERENWKRGVKVYYRGGIPPECL
jgi:uncharacterized lipoprotein